MRTRKLPPLAMALSMAGLLALATGPGCDPDLGDPVLRYADWDATVPEDDGGLQTAELSDWLPPCGQDTYPCPPYSTGRGGVIADIRMVAANPSAMDYADDDGIFSLADLRKDGHKLLFVFMTAGW